MIFGLIVARFPNEKSLWQEMNDGGMLPVFQNLYLSVSQLF